MTEQTAAPARNRQVGRFTLIDLVQDRSGAQIWRAIDITLNREVALWLLPATDERVPDLEEATRTASAVPDRRIARILDVFRADGWFAMVTEWTSGQVLRDHLQEPLPAPEAARIAYEVARALESAHASGIAHGLVRPRNVVVADDGEVRLTGLGIDAVLSGIEPSAGNDPVKADIHGIGAILYAGLTARWPDGDIGDLPAAPEVGGHVPPPSRILADVPESLDDVCARTVTTIVPPRGRPELTSVSAVRELLGSGLTDLTGSRETYFAKTPRRSVLPRLLAAAAAVAAMLGVGFFGFRMLTGSPADNSAAPNVSATVSKKPTVLETPKLTTYRIASGEDFDPLGNREENPAGVPFAYDGDASTAWRTVTYFNKTLDKPGVGLLFDLGAPRSVKQVKLTLVGNGTDLQVLTSTEKGTNPKDFDLMAQATEAGEKVTLKSPKPVSARYVLIWFTGLPQVDGGWRGGVREVKISG
ncbi:MAG: protein kinase family protein [Candidatus Nanopelagicales bacterium]